MKDENTNVISFTAFDSSLKEVIDDLEFMFISLRFIRSGRYNEGEWSKGETKIFKQAALICVSIHADPSTYVQAAFSLYTHIRGMDYLPSMLIRPEVKERYFELQADRQCK